MRALRAPFTREADRYPLEMDGSSAVSIPAIVGIFVWLQKLSLNITSFSHDRYIASMISPVPHFCQRRWQLVDI